MTFSALALPEIIDATTMVVAETAEAAPCYRGGFEFQPGRLIPIPSQRRRMSSGTPNRVRDNHATGSEVDGACCVPRGAARGNAKSGTYAATTTH